MNYKDGGYDTLVPQARSDAGKSRKLDPDAQERIRYYKTNYPHINEVWCAYRN